ncbi:MAG: glycosyl hydrolase [Leeuwenhoekiella sp.]
MKIKIFVSIFVMGTLFSLAQNQTFQSLEEGFNQPPPEARPRTWMHAMSGNMSKEGMTKDLEAIAAAGQGGILLFNVATGIPYGDIKYDSPKHHDIIAHTAKESERLGLSFGVHNCDGWSSSGGPWVEPEESMKMVVHSDTIVDVKSGKIEVSLPLPTVREGFYKDIAVLAYPALEAEKIDAVTKPKIEASDKGFNIARATDNRIEETAGLNKNGDEDSWILYDYKKPFTLRSIYIAVSDRNGDAELEVSDDGETFRPVKKLSKVRSAKSEWNFIDRLDPITSRYFRIRFNENMNIKELSLKATSRFDNFIGFSGLAKTSTNNLSKIAAPEAGMVVNRDDIINLTPYLSGDGSLKASLPKGKWTILRFGNTSTGATNTPASIWGRGLECDKFSRPAFKKHWDNFVQEVIDNTKKLAPNALQYIEIDSYEMGGQNWTDGFEDIYKEEKGYSIIDFLPLFAGRYIDDLDTTQRVLWDMNDVFCDLMENNYYKYFTELCNKNGLKSYTEPYGMGHINEIDVTGVTDIPMTEFWMGRSLDRVFSTVTAAHVYGKKVISAESFTSRPELNWKMSPADAKVSGDNAWVRGVNEFMFHRFVHQSNTHVAPGLTMGQWGSHIDRTQTWWMNAGKAWFDYIAKGSYLLRQGYPVADVLVFIGDNSHNGNILRHRLTPEVPMGLNFDCTNADVLVNRISLEDEMMVLPEGNAYSYLILKDINTITLPTLRRLKEIADSGVTMIGIKPEKLAGYTVTDSQRREFDALIASIWSQPNVRIDYDFNALQPDFRVVGEDHIFLHRRTDTEDIYFFNNETSTEKTYECVFRIKDKIPEMWNAETGEITKLALFKNEGEFTRAWLTLDSEESAFIVFRESSDGVTSIVKPDFDNSYYLDQDNNIKVISSFEGKSSVNLSNGKTSEVSFKKTPAPMDISSNWEVKFLGKNFYDSEENFKTLSDWKDNQNDSIKYYSGTAIYSKKIKLPRTKDDMRTYLDLGDVKIVAEVLVNGKTVDVLWKAPFKTDITDYVRKGENNIEVKITNQWSNQMIRDQEFSGDYLDFKQSPYYPSETDTMPDWFINNEPMPDGPRKTFNSYQFYKKGDDLMPSGLLGPVHISFKKEGILSID